MKTHTHTHVHTQQPNLTNVNEVWLCYSISNVASIIGAPHVSTVSRLSGSHIGAHRSCDLQTLVSTIKGWWWEADECYESDIWVHYEDWLLQLSHYPEHIGTSVTSSACRKAMPECRPYCVVDENYSRMETWSFKVWGYLVGDLSTIVLHTKPCPNVQISSKYTPSIVTMLPKRRSTMLVKNLGFRDLGVWSDLEFPIIATLTDIEYVIYIWDSKTKPNWTCSIAVKAKKF